MPKDKTPHFFRRTFIAGLLILLPLFVTYILIAFLFELFSSVGAPVVKGLFRVWDLDPDPATGPLVPLVNLLLSLAVIFLLGLFGTNILGRRVLARFESLLLKVPLVKGVYSSAKQLVDTFQGPNRSFQRVVLVQYPRPGLWSVGLVATERMDNLRLMTSGKILTVFIPTTPNPTSGFLVIVSSDEVRDLDFTVEEAFKFIISGGIVGKDLVVPSRLL